MLSNLLQHTNQYFKHTPKPYLLKFTRLATKIPFRPSKDGVVFRGITGGNVHLSLLKQAGLIENNQLL
jgi:hypothetical protein